MDHDVAGVVLDQWGEVSGNRSLRMTPTQRDLLIDLAKPGLLSGEQSTAIRAALMEIERLEREVKDGKYIGSRLAKRVIELTA